MFVVLMLLYPSVRIVLQLLNALPTAFIGGAVGPGASRGQPLTVASLVGFISLGGIAVRNGILLVTHYFHLMQEEGESFSQAMILRGSLERLAPVLMTALTAGIGLVPLVLGGQEPGREILYPVATVILGGLVDLDLLRVSDPPGPVLEVQRPGCLAARPGRDWSPTFRIERSRVFLRSMTDDDLIQQPEVLVSFSTSCRWPSSPSRSLGLTGCGQPLRRRHVRATGHRDGHDGRAATIMPMTTITAAMPRATTSTGPGRTAARSPTGAAGNTTSSSQSITMPRRP